MKGLAVRRSLVGLNQREAMVMECCGTGSAGTHMYHFLIAPLRCAPQLCQSCFRLAVDTVRN